MTDVDALFRSSTASSPGSGAKSPIHKAVAQVRDDLPRVLDALREQIDEPTAK